MNMISWRWLRALACVTLCSSVVATTASAVPKRKKAKASAGKTAIVPPRPGAGGPPATRGPIPREGALTRLPAVAGETVAKIMDRQRRTPKTFLPPTVSRELPYPDRSKLPDDPDAPAVSSIVDGVASAAAESARVASNARPPFVAAPLVAQTLGTSFTGATLADGALFPPDSMGTIGPAQYVVAVNNRFRSFNKTTGVADGVMDVSPDVFFAGIVKGPTFVTSDPRVRYDRLSGRWFIVMIDFDTRPLSTTPANFDPTNRILLAWTDAASGGVISASTVWSFSFIDQAACLTCLEDYPTLGIDANALYIGTNTFPFNTTIAGNYDFGGTGAYVLPKAPLLAGAGAFSHFNLVTSASGTGPYTPQGVDNYDPAATEGYFVGVDNATFSRLALARVSNPGTTPAMSANIFLTVLTTSYPVSTGVPHLGNTAGNNGNLDALDDRLFAAHIRKGRLWTAHNIQVNRLGVGSTSGGRDAVRWYELNGIRSTDNGGGGVGVPVVAQSGTIFDSAVSNPRFFWIPSVMVSGQGHAAFGFSTAGITFRANAVTTGRLAGDTAATVQVLTAYAASSTAYNPPSDPGGPLGRRWGDYSYTSLDPLDDMTMWTIQEFCDTTDSYGVRVVKLIAPPPATPLSASPLAVAKGLASKIVSLTGLSTAGSGFFDPGANLAPPALNFSHISAAVSGGVVVNSVQYIDPTHVTLDLDTRGGTIGSVNVTITNPDGQSATGTGILTLSLDKVTNVVAAATSGSTAHVTWNPVSGATSYQVLRRALFTDPAGVPVGAPVATTFTDDSLLLGDASYLYSVVAIAGAAMSAESAFDLATTTVYSPGTEDPLVSMTTTVNAADLTKTRSAVKAVRATAGLADFTYTNATFAAGQPVRSTDVTETRTALNEALSPMGFATLAPANSAASGTPIREIDVNEIRNGTK